MMAAALIPHQRDSADPFWVTAARQLFANGAAVFCEKGVREIAETRVRYGYRRIHVLLRREGWQVSAKQIYRLVR